LLPGGQNCGRITKKNFKKMKAAWESDDRISGRIFRKNADKESHFFAGFFHFLPFPIWLKHPYYAFLPVFVEINKLALGFTPLNLITLSNTDLKEIFANQFSKLSLNYPCGPVFFLYGTNFLLGIAEYSWLDLATLRGPELRVRDREGKRLLIDGGGVIVLPHPPPPAPSI
jgi:hypothetical protein